MMERLFSIEEVAHRLGVTVPLVLKWVDDCKIAATLNREGGCVVRVSEFERVAQTAGGLECAQEALNLYHEYLELIARCELLSEGGYSLNSVECREYRADLSEFIRPLCVCGDTAMCDLYKSINERDVGKICSLGELLKRLRGHQKLFLPAYKPELCFKLYVHVTVNCNGYTLRSPEDYLRVKPIEGAFFIAYVDYKRDYSELLIAAYKAIYKAAMELDGMKNAEGKYEFRRSFVQCSLKFIDDEARQKLNTQYISRVGREVTYFFSYDEQIIPSVFDSMSIRVYNGIDDFAKQFGKAVDNCKSKLIQRRRM